MTHSYGNGRRLDDGKALAGLSFQVKVQVYDAMLFGFHLEHQLIIFSWFCRLETTWMWRSYRVVLKCPKTVMVLCSGYLEMVVKVFICRWRFLYSINACSYGY